MEILNSENRTWYLKAININDQSNVLWLSFRQEHLYVIDRYADKNQHYYQNVTLLLWFEDDLTTHKYFKLLKDFYLNQVISIDEYTPNIIEFVGGHDLNVEVVKYQENITDQSMEDWINRYVWVSKRYFERYDSTELIYLFIKDIESILKRYQQTGESASNLYKDISEKHAKVLGSIKKGGSEELLSSINRQLYSINEKLDALTKM